MNIKKPQDVKAPQLPAGFKSQPVRCSQQSEHFPWILDPLTWILDTACSPRLHTYAHTTQLCTHTPDTMHCTEQTVHAVVCSSHHLLQRQIQKVLGGHAEELTSTNCKSKQLQKHIPLYFTFFLFSPLDENNPPQISCHYWSFQIQLPYNLPFSSSTFKWWFWFHLFH